MAALGFVEVWGEWNLNKVYSRYNLIKIEDGN